MWWPTRSNSLFWYIGKSCWVRVLTFFHSESTCRHRRAFSIGLLTSRQDLDRPHYQHIAPARARVLADFPVLSALKVKKDRDRTGWRTEVREICPPWHYWPSPPWRRQPRRSLYYMSCFSVRKWNSSSSLWLAEGHTCWSGETSCDTAGYCEWVAAFNELEASQ